MSGRKEYPITITNVQWEEMSNQIQTAYSQARVAQNYSLSAANTRRLEQLAAARRISELQARYDQDVRGLNNELQMQTRRQGEVLNRAQSEFNARLTQQGVHFNNALREHRLEMERSLIQTRDNLQNQIDTINSRMENEKRSNLEVANFWIEQADAILRDIDAGYRHELFNPNQLNNLRTLLTRAQGDASANRSEAALVGARDVCDRALVLRDQVVMNETEWTNILNQINLRILEAKRLLESLDDLQYEFTEEGEKVVIPAEVDFWSRGGFSEVKTQLERIEESMRSIASFNNRDMINMLEQVENANKRLEGAGELARRNFIASQLRCEIGAEMESLLPAWVLEEVLFKGEDEREDLHLIFRHRNGLDQLSLTIKGGEEGRESTSVTSDFFCNSTQNLDIRNEWIQDIYAAITQNIDPNARMVIPHEYANSRNGDKRLLDVKEIKKPLKQQLPGN